MVNLNHSISKTDDLPSDNATINDPPRPVKQRPWLYAKKDSDVSTSAAITSDNATIKDPSSPVKQRAWVYAKRNQMVGDKLPHRTIRHLRTLLRGLLFLKHHIEQCLQKRPIMNNLSAMVNLSDLPPSRTLPKDNMWIILMVTGRRVDKEIVTVINMNATILQISPVIQFVILIMNITIVGRKLRTIIMVQRTIPATGIATIIILTIDTPILRFRVVGTHLHISKPSLTMVNHMLTKIFYTIVTQKKKLNLTFKSRRERGKMTRST